MKKQRLRQTKQLAPIESATFFSGVSITLGWYVKWSKSEKAWNLIAKLGLVGFLQAHTETVGYI